MAGVTNNCRHCDGVLYDEETARKHCAHCGKPDWDSYKLESRETLTKKIKQLTDEVARLHSMLHEQRNSDTVTIYTVEEMQDEEGRRWGKIAVTLDKAEAEALKGNSNYRNIKTLTVFTSPPILRGIEVNSWSALKRHPVESILNKQEKLQAIKSKLSGSEFDFLAKHFKELA